MRRRSRQLTWVHKDVAAIVVAIVLILFAIGTYLGRKTLLLAIGDFLAVHDELQPADVIHVIAGEDYRTDYAIQLYQQGYGKRLFFTGGWCQFHHYDHGEHGKALAFSRGVPLEAIVVDDTAVTSTYSETVRLRAWIASASEHTGSVIIVSDAYHMRRARWTARHVLDRSVAVQVASVPPENSPYPRDWWTSELARQYVRDEYLKLLYYHLRYQFGGGPLATWLAGLDRN